jgi:hypothetical protein
VILSKRLAGHLVCLAIDTENKGEEEKKTVKNVEFVQEKFM